MSTPRPIPDSYWVIPGKLLAGEYPGAKTDEAARQKLGRLLDAGVTHFIDLTEAGEYNLRPYASLAAELGRERKTAVTHARLSIPDMGTPPSPQMVKTLDAIDAAIDAGAIVYVHCFGGIGRTGTVVGCYLVRHGRSGEDAIAQIAQWRANTPNGHRASPETAAQRQVILGWQQEQ